MALFALDRSSSVSTFRRLRYRVGQFLISLWSRVAADERAILALWLPPPAALLFQNMARRDQRHSLNVFYTLRSSGYEQADLLAAALLHDVGKTVHQGRRLRLGHRVIIVVLKAIQPALLERLSAAGEAPGDWRHPFYVHQHHPQLGARLAREAGCSELTASLIRRHQTRLPATLASEDDRLLAALHAADDAN